MLLDAIGLDNVEVKLFQPVKPPLPFKLDAIAIYLRFKGDGKDKVLSV